MPIPDMHKRPTPIAGRERSPYSWEFEIYQISVVRIRADSTKMSMGKDNKKATQKSRNEFKTDSIRGGNAGVLGVKPLGEGLKPGGDFPL